MNGIKVIGITDVNIDPDATDYAIIGNDDAISSVKYVLDKLKEVVAASRPKTAA
jgi:small subunit ribosomal protein S2